MNQVWIPEGYESCLGLYDTQKAIGLIKNLFQQKLCLALHLKRVTAPLFVTPSSGLNDDLNGVERPVGFDIPAVDGGGGEGAQVVHSLAKWKRMALYRYDFYPGNGLLTDMNAIRRDEEIDNLHSVYVDQWDWEKVILPEQRTLAYLQETVKKIVGVICNTMEELQYYFPQLPGGLSRDITFVTAQELEDRWPDLSPKEREDALLGECRTAFIMQIGGKLRSGQRHDGRAPDYDDWTLNGDLLFWDDVLRRSIELSSMGIRVDPAALDRQLTEAGCDNRRSLTFHKMLLEGKLPLTIGGGIGQSRLCMLLLHKAHIGEVQVSVWDKETLAACRDAGIELL